MGRFTTVARPDSPKRGFRGKIAGTSWEEAKDGTKDSSHLYLEILKPQISGLKM